jgi:hypothetical protein
MAKMGICGNHTVHYVLPYVVSSVTYELTPPLLSLLPFFRSTPPTSTPPRTCSQKSFVSLARRARLRELWCPVCRGVPVCCPITQRHHRTDPGHLLSLLFGFAHSQPGLSVANRQDFWQYYVTGSSTDGQVGTQSEISSWLLPKDVIETEKPEKLAEELIKISERHG